MHETTERSAMLSPSRVLLFASLLTTLACGSGVPTRVAVSPGLVPGAVGPREQSAERQVRHVLSRLTFGARPGDAQRVRDLGVDRWIDEQLHPDRIADGVAEQFFAGFESYATSAQEMQRRYPPPAVLLNRLGAAGDRSKLSAEDSALLQQ